MTIGTSTAAVGAQDNEEMAQTQTFELNFGEYYFAPDALTARPGTITLNLTNMGPERVHALNLQDTEGNDIYMGERVEPGASLTIEFSLFQEGTYPFYCPIGSHAERGEVGTLTITAA
jgi:uncharacterized cupredoxin-like copper-binding protein